MIGTVPPASPRSPVHRIQPARAPIAFLPRQFDPIGTLSAKPVQNLTPIGQMGVARGSINVRA